MNRLDLLDLRVNSLALIVEENQHHVIVHVSVWENRIGTTYWSGLLTAIVSSAHA